MEDECRAEMANLGGCVITWSSGEMKDYRNSMIFSHQQIQPNYGVQISHYQQQIRNWKLSTIHYNHAEISNHSYYSLGYWTLVGALDLRWATERRSLKLVASWKSANLSWWRCQTIKNLGKLTISILQTEKSDSKNFYI